MKFLKRTIVELVLFVLPLVLFTACGELPSEASPGRVAPRQVKVGQSPNLYADGDCSWSWNCTDYASTPWLLQTSTTTAPFPYAWWNSTKEHVCTIAGCKQDCWTLIDRCTAIFPQINGGECTVYLCGSGGDGSAPPCDYRNPPPGGCDTKLTKRDTTILIKAVANFTRTTFTDTAAARQCGELRAWLLGDLRSMTPGLSRAVNNDPAVIDGVPHPHWGATYGVAHLDPRALDQALQMPNNAARQKRLAEVALHETAHMNSKDHPGDTPGSYVSDYFKFLNNPADSNNAANPNACITW